MQLVVCYSKTLQIKQFKVLKCSAVYPQQNLKSPIQFVQMIKIANCYESILTPFFYQQDQEYKFALGVLQCCYGSYCAIKKLSVRKDPLDLRSKDFDCKDWQL